MYVYRLAISSFITINYLCDIDVQDSYIICICILCYSQVSALHALHSQRLLHRDVKAQNVFLLHPLPPSSSLVQTRDITRDHDPNHPQLDTTTLDKRKNSNTTSRDQKNSHYNENFSNNNPDKEINDLPAEQVPPVLLSDLGSAALLEHTNAQRTTQVCLFFILFELYIYNVWQVAVCCVQTCIYVWACIWVGV